MSMAISPSSLPPMPPASSGSSPSSTIHQRPAQNVTPEPSLQFQTHHSNSSSNLVLTSPGKLPMAAPSSYHGSQASNVSLSSNEGGSGSAGQRLRALANRRFRKKASGGTASREESEDGYPVGDISDVMSSTEGPTPTQNRFPQQNLRPPVVPSRERAQSDAEGLVGNRSPRSNPRLKIESKIQAFASNLRRNHAGLTQPGLSSTRDVAKPVPPPKPDTLRAPPSPNRSGYDTSQTDSPSSVRPPSTVARSSPTSAISSSSHNSVVISQTPLPKTVVTAVAKVVADKRNSPPTLGVLRNSFQMSKTPSITAALHYMHGIGPEDKDQGKENQQKEAKKEKRRSAGILKTVPENTTSVPLAASSSQTSTDQAASSSSIRAAVPRPGLTTTPSKNRNRRSASLGDIFKSSGGWNPASALASVGATGSSKEPKPINAAQAMKNRPPNAHRRSPSNGSGTSSSLDGLARTISNSSPLNPASAANVAATYQYVNAELREDGGPSFFLGPRPPSGSAPPSPPVHMPSNVFSSDYAFPPIASPSHPPTFSVTPASAAAPMSTVPPKPVGGIIAPLLPPRKKSAVMDAYGNADGGDSSDAESNLSGNSRGNLMGSNLKGRLAAITSTGSATPPPLPQRMQQNNIPPGAYSAPPTASATPRSFSSSTSSSPGSNSSRARASSSNVSNNYSSQRPVVPNTNALSRSTNTQNYSPAVTSAAGTIGVAAGMAGGMAMNFGRRVGNLWGHRSGQSVGGWGNLAGGYVTDDGQGGRNSSEGMLSDAGGGYASTAPKGGTRMLGPLLRPPTRQGRGAVFGRSLQECVAETRAGVRAASRVVDDRGRGEGLWVTALVTRCVAHLTRWGLEEEGLFRITGRQTHVAKIRGEFDTGADYDLREAHPSDLDPHAVSSVFKAYLRELPEPILTKKLMPLFDLALSLGMQGQANEESRLIGVTSFGGGVAFDGNHLPTEDAMVELKGLMDQLPAENYDLLHELSKFLRLTAEKADVTKMPLSNLLLVFCPSLHLNPAFLQLIIQRQDYFFGEGEMGKVAAPVAAVDKVDDTCDTPSQLVSLKGPTLPSRPTRTRDFNNSDEARRNRTASVMIPGFSVTFEAYAESVAQLASAPIPIRTHPTALGPSLHPSPGPGTPASSIASTPSRSRPAAAPQPSPVPSLKARVARRQPSLASLFSSNKLASTPVISGPIPYVPATPAEPPVLDIELPHGSFSVGAGLGYLKDERKQFPIVQEAQSDDRRRPAPSQDGDSPTSSSSSGSEHLHVPVTGRPDSIPRPIAQSITADYSPPPRISMLDTPLKRSTGDGWAAGVLMAASGDN
ncbi:hypothetical protein FRB98_002152 [Tulasnella sp. 332]|nr:hypothetical protein FRB98_002152 [Tulasnella sp. 332]